MASIVLYICIYILSRSIVVYNTLQNSYEERVMIWCVCVMCVCVYVCVCVANTKWVVL